MEQLPASNAATDAVCPAGRRVRHGGPARRCWTSRLGRTGRPASVACTTRRGRSGSSSCSCPAARPRWTPSTPSRCSQRYEGRRLPGPRTEHQPAARQTAPARQRLSRRPGNSQRYGAVRHRRQRAVPARRRVRGRPVRAPVDVLRQLLPRPGHAGDDDRQRPVRPAEHGLVAAVRPGHREPQPARIPRPRRADRQRRSGQGVRLGVPPGRVPGHAPSPNSARPDPQPARPGSRPPSSVANSTCCAASTRCTSPSAPQESALEARIQTFETAFRMQTRGGRGVRPVTRVASDATAVRHRRSGDGRLRPEVPAGPAAGRTRRPLRASSTTATGTSTAG